MCQHWIDKGKAWAVGKITLGARPYKTINEIGLQEISGGDVIHPCATRQGQTDLCYS